MDAIGAQEVHFPALLPREPYEATGRWTEYGDNIFRLKDRKGADYLLGPTHEEMFTLLVKDLYSSYKDLPLSLYQIQTKYRDEARPRAGLLRGREFVMKDSYSFDVDDAGLDASLPGAPRRLHPDLRPARLRLRHRRRRCRARWAARAREEFLANAEVGEDTYVRCTNCDYAANVEAVQVPAARRRWRTTTHPPRTPRTPPTPRPSRRWSTHLNAAFPRDDRPWTAGDTLKNVLVVLVHPDGTREPLAIGLPGDREVDLKRLEAPGRAGRGRAVRRGGLREAPGAGQGLHRPRRARARRAESGIRYLVDPRVVDGHALGDRRQRARQPRHRPRRRPRLHAPTAPSRPPRCATATRAPTATPARSRSPAASRWATSSSSAASTPRRSDLQVLDENGKLVTVTMGSYGIGVVARRRGDRRGHPRRARPRAGRARSRPADVHLVATGKDDEVFAAAERARRTSSRRRGSPCSTTTGPARSAPA